MGQEHTNKLNKVTIWLWQLHGHTWTNHCEKAAQSQLVVVSSKNSTSQSKQDAETYSTLQLKKSSPTRLVAYSLSTISLFWTLLIDRWL